MSREYHLPPAQHASRIDYQKELNEQQYLAVTSPPGPALVIAGAGSGKTRTLIYRVAYLLDNGIAPESILLLTFTNKAAREMMERVEGLLGQSFATMWGGTFHSIGNKILRRHAETVGLRRSFTIMDREDQKDLLQAVLASWGKDTAGPYFPKAEVLLDIFSHAINQGQSLEQSLVSRYGYLEKAHEGILEVSDLFVKKKKSANCVDFDDLLTLTEQVLRENPGIADYYQQQFQFVLVDEYQDTNKVQAALVDLISAKHGNLMVVGDDAQSIYSWRGANFENILNFPQKYPNGQVYRIEMNYRSVPEVLALANESILVNERQFKKNLLATRVGEGVRPAFVPLDNPTTQAAFIAHRILELQSEGVDLEHIAVLYRAHFHSMELQIELTKRGIPYQITSGMRFFEQAHIKDVAAFLRFVTNRQDEIAFKRMVRLVPGVAAGTAQKLWDAWVKSPASTTEGPVSFAETLLSFKVTARSKKVWEQVAHTLEECLTPTGYAAPTAMIYSVLEGFYDEYLKAAYENYDVRKADLESLARYSSSFPDTLEFLTQMSLLSGIDDGPKSRGQAVQGAIVLSTVHQAKGLEWSVVFVIWLAEGMFPNSRAIEGGDANSLEEERRLFYVGVTRAMDQLYLTYPVLWPGARDGDYLRRPSRFLTELDPERMEEWKVRRF